MRGLSGGAWGGGFLLRLFQVGNLQAYAFSLRPRHRRADLLHGFPLMLLFIVFAPLVTALLILVGAPGAADALCSARARQPSRRWPRSLATMRGRRFPIRQFVADQREAGVFNFCSARTA